LRLRTGLLRKRNPPLHRPPLITIPHPPIKHLCMTGTIAGIDIDLTILTTLQRSNSG